jgi:6-pyruvoyltetrahydropterin/6-carboxytetrahydropterin synthase
MYELMVETTFSAAHQLRGYKGKCENLHGHTWRVQIYVSATELNEIDLAIDFHDLKQIAQDITAPLDHACINEIFPFTQRNPSSENIARWIFDGVQKRLTDYPGITASAVTVWESDTSSATYSQD